MEKKVQAVQRSAHFFLWGLLGTFIGQFLLVVGYNMHWDSMLRTGQGSPGLMAFGGLLAFVSMIWLAVGVYRLAKNVDATALKVLERL